MNGNCGKCGEELRAGWALCPRCGTKLGGAPGAGPGEVITTVDPYATKLKGVIPLEREGLMAGKGYGVIRSLPPGGMAELYQVWKGRNYVFKFLKKEYGGDLEYVRRFIAEAKRTTSIEHPNVIRIYEYETDENAAQHYYVMEYMPDGTLQERLKRNGKLPVEEAVGIVRQVAGALCAAHEKVPQPIVHRDIKPSNILFEGERVVVADFGIAKAVGGETKMTVFGQVVGSSGYMSPEQLRGQVGKIDARTDMYALGAVLYRMLTGREVFGGPTEAAVAAQHLMKPVVPPAVLEPGVPGYLSGVVVAMLEKDPERRVPGMRVLLNLLGEAPDGETAAHYTRIHAVSLEAYRQGGDDEEAKTRLKPAAAVLNVSADEQYQRLCGMWSQYLAGMGAQVLAGAAGVTSAPASFVSCPKCGQIVGTGDAACAKCGADITKLRRICPQCRSPYLAGNKYCTKCKRELAPREIDDFINALKGERFAEAYRIFLRRDTLKQCIETEPVYGDCVEEILSEIVNRAFQSNTLDKELIQVIRSIGFEDLAERFQVQHGHYVREMEINDLWKKYKLKEITNVDLRISILDQLTKLGDDRAYKEMEKLLVFTRKQFMTIGVIAASAIIFTMVLFIFSLCGGEALNFFVLICTALIVALTYVRSSYKKVADKCDKGRIKFHFSS